MLPIHIHLQTITNTAATAQNSDSLTSMHATITFNLPEEQQEHRDALDGTAWKLVVRNLDNTLRTALKHGHNLASANAALEEMRTRLYTEIEEQGLSL